jgi:hypothetical protein
MCGSTFRGIRRAGTMPAVLTTLVARGRVTTRV